MELSTAKRNPPPWEVVYNISKKINSKAMPLKAFWLGKSHLLCRWSFTENPEYFHDNIFLANFPFSNFLFTKYLITLRRNNSSSG